MKRIVIALCLLAGLGSCQIYRTYQRPELPEVDSLFRQPVQGADTTSLADLTWRELFTDSRLQRLIDSGIMNNSDLQIARLRVAEARASLTASRLAYLPSLSLTPQGAVNAPEYALGPAPTIWRQPPNGRSTSSGNCSTRSAGLRLRWPGRRLTVRRSRRSWWRPSPTATIRC